MSLVVKYYVHLSVLDEQNQITYTRLWRSWITQQIPILKNGGSNPSGQAKKDSTLLCGIFFIFTPRGI